MIPHICACVAFSMNISNVTIWLYFIFYDKHHVSVRTVLRNVINMLPSLWLPPVEIYSYLTSQANVATSMCGFRHLAFFHLCFAFSGSKMYCLQCHVEGKKWRMPSCFTDSRFESDLHRLHWHHISGNESQAFTSHTGSWEMRSLPGQLFSSDKPTIEGKQKILVLS